MSDEQTPVAEMMEKERNLLSSEEIRTRMLDEHDDLETSKMPTTEINGVKGVLLAGSHMDSAPDLSFVYNLQTVTRYPEAGTFSTTFYKKIDEGKVAYAFYLGNYSSFLIEIN